MQRSLFALSSGSYKKLRPMVLCGAFCFPALACFHFPELSLLTRSLLVHFFRFGLTRILCGLIILRA